MSSLDGTQRPVWAGSLAPDAPAVVPPPIAGLQKLLQMAGVAAWTIGSFALSFFVTAPGVHRLQLAQAQMSGPSLWIRQGHWSAGTATLAIFLGVLVIGSRARLINKMAVLSVLLALSVVASALSVCGYVVVANDQVLIHPMLPWHRDARFALGNATVVARGCRFWRSRSSAHHDVIFTVRANGNGHLVELGGEAADDMRNWLAVMRDYGTGALRLPADAAVRAPHDEDCMQFWLSGRDAQQQAELTRLLT